ncbi:MAG TPA: alkaline phosphatase family protein [Terriglobales bacterium]|nr:alkaline phosphatase family protein [Terriglobales bacterium]
MKYSLRATLVFFLCLCLCVPIFASAYNAHPRLIVILIIDQLRADYLERYHDQFVQGGFRLFLDHGANFTNCNYDYANTRTAPGHATLLSGAYSDSHGIMANEWWDPQKKKMVSSVQDDEVKIVGPSDATPASPHNLGADTLGDELKLATQGKARVYGLSLKDRSAILAAGFSADGAYWTDPKTGMWITSTFYRTELPKWVQDFNTNPGAQAYWNREWKDASGHTLRSTAPHAARKGSPGAFAEIIGSTPFANDYQFDFARQLLTNEHLGTGPVTDLLVISLSANDILGHQVGPDDPQIEAMMLATDRQLAGFFSFLGQQLGLANVWLALSADHGISPLPEVASRLRIPAGRVRSDRAGTELNNILSDKLSPGHPAEYVKGFHYPLAWLNEDAFSALKMKEEDAERAVGEAMQQLGLLGYFTRTQLARGEVPNSAMGRRFLHSYAPIAAWYVMGVPRPYTVGSGSGTDHTSPYTYDTHVPLSFYGLAFQPGAYRTHAEPVDLAVTLASLLGINAPDHAIGRVLTEALPPAPPAQNSAQTKPDFPPHSPLDAAPGGLQ